MKAPLFSRFNGYCERHSYKPKSVLSVICVLILIILALGYFSLQSTNVSSKATSCEISPYIS